MSKLLAVGLTKAGSEKNINEDSFHCMTRIYPDTLDRLEIQSGQSEDHWQIYSVTDGMGGSGIGDISGRLVQEDLISQVAELGNLDPQTFDFAEFAFKFISTVKLKLKERLAKYSNQEVGCSLAFLLVNGSTAYTLSIGTNRLYLIRDNKIHRMSKEHRSSTDRTAKPTMFLGNSLNGIEAKPDNLNKLILQQGDVVFILSDGVHDVLSDNQILKISESNKSFVKVIDAFNTELQEKNVADDCTVLGLKVLEASSINISEQLTTDQPTEPINIKSVRNVAKEKSYHAASNRRAHNYDADFHQEFDGAYDDEYSDEHYDDHFYSDGGKKPILQDLDKIESKSKFVQWLILFLKSYGIGLAVGGFLVLMFWLIYFKLR